MYPYPNSLSRTVGGFISALGVTTETTCLAQSAGMMVNYLYDRAKIDANHEAYVTGSESPASSGVRNLL